MNIFSADRVIRGRTVVVLDDGSFSCNIFCTFDRFGNATGTVQQYSDGRIIRHAVCRRRGRLRLLLKEYCTNSEIPPHISDQADDKQT